MKRWILKGGSTGLNDLLLEEVEIPEPQKGEVRVKIQAASLNYRDIVVMQNQKGMGVNHEIIPLSDGAGIIDAVGEDVSDWKIGDAVITQLYPNWKDGKITSTIGLGLGSNDQNGTLAEYVILSTQNIISAPKSLSAEEAAILPCAGITAWSGIQGNRPYTSPLSKNEKVLILGTGGVAMCAISIALAIGAEVYCTTSQPAKSDVLKKMGVKDVVNYKENKDWGKTIFNLTNEGVDLVVNTAGTASIGQSIDALALGGRMSLIGAMENSDQVDNMLLLIQKNITLFGVLTGSEQAYKDYINFIDTHKVKTHIDAVYPFLDAKKAYQHIMTGDVFGKVIIKF